MRKTGNNREIILTVSEVITILLFAGVVLYYFENNYFSDSYFLLFFASVAIITAVLMIASVLLSKKGKYLLSYITQIIPLLLFAAGFVYTQKDIKVNRTAIEIKEEVSYKKETRGLSLVTYRADLESIDDVSARNNIGCIDNAASVEGYQMIRDLIDQQGLQAEVTYFSSYYDLLSALYNRNIDIAALPEDYQNIFTSFDGYQDFLNICHSVFTYRKNNTVQTMIRGKDDVQKFTVLLLGKDGLKSTSMILMSVNTDDNVITLTTIPLNTYTEIAAYKEGTKDTLEQCGLISRKAISDTVEELTGVSIDYFIEMDESTIVEVIDSLSGIQIDIPVSFSAEYDDVYNDGDYEHTTLVSVEKGNLIRNGRQVYVTMRNPMKLPYGEKDRVTLCTEFVEGMIDALRKSENTKTFYYSVITDMSLEKMNEVLSELKTSKVEYLSYQLEGEEDWQYQLSSDTARDVLYISDDSLEANRSLIEWNLGKRNSYILPDGSIGDEEQDEQGEEESLVLLNTLDLLPRMAHVYFRSDAEEWAENHEWIDTEFVEVKKGNPLFEDIYNEGYIKDIADIYKLNNYSEELSLLEGFGPKMLDNLFNNIEQSKNNSLERLLFALGIRQVGSKTAKILARKYKTLDNLMNASVEQLTEINDIGNIIANSIVDYFSKEENIDIINKLISYGVNTTYISNKDINELFLYNNFLNYLRLLNYL